MLVEKPFGDYDDYEYDDYGDEDDDTYDDDGDDLH